ncbi:MAG: hypothetical protein GY754_09860 [bacterium]|nr:hypothetical protein [bacterium]
MKQHYKIIFCVAFVCVLFVSCSGGNHHVSNNIENNRIPLQNIPPDGKTIHYFGTPLSHKQYAKRKKLETMKLKNILKETYGYHFKTRATKYFNIAYRCSEKKMDHFQKYINAFFEQVYPRYFIYEPDHIIQIVFYKNAPEFYECAGSKVDSFYSPITKTLFTYPDSGHGSVWHELIHAFIDTNTDVQTQQWFEEGFASFYERAFLIDGKVVEGYTNWRVDRLHAAMKKNKIAHLKDFTYYYMMRETYGYAEGQLLFCYLWTHDVMELFVKTYIYNICPRHKRLKLNKATIAYLEELMGKNIDDINSDFLAFAKSVKKDQKLYKSKNLRRPKKPILKKILP